MWTGANRPVRRRKGVSHYSDDNPNTFTVKLKKGEEEEEEEEQSDAKQQKTSSSRHGRRNRTSGQRRNSGSASSSRSSPSSFAALTAAASSVNNRSKSLKTKGKTEDAAKVGNLYYGVSSFPRHHQNNNNHNKRRLTNQQQQQQQPVEPPPPPEQHDTVLAHACAIQPILPWNVLTTTTAATHAASLLLYDSRFTPSSLMTPVWKAVPQQLHQHSSMSHHHHVSTSSTTTTAAAAGSTTAQLHVVAQGAASMTWFSVRQDDGQYGVTGDCFGALTLYRLDTGGTTLERPLQVIRSSSACWRERQRVLVSKRIISYPNAVVQCSWCRGGLVILTNTELEILQICNHQGGNNSNDGAKIIASYPVATTLTESSQLAKKIAAQQSPCLQVLATTNASQHKRKLLPNCHHPVAVKDNAISTTNYQLLWTTCHREFYHPQPDDDDDRAASTATTTVNSLLILEWNVNEVEDKAFGGTTMIATTMQDAVVVKKLVASFDGAVDVFRCWTTLWENNNKKKSHRSDDSAAASWKDDPTFLMIAQTRSDTIELLRGRRRKRSVAPEGLVAGSVNGINDEGDCPTSRFQPQHFVGVEEEFVDVLTRQKLPFASSRGGWYNNSLVSTELVPTQDCCLQQFERYTFVTGAAARGIRMYLTNDLAPVATFGETVQLHGKVVLWNRCAWVKAPAVVKKADIRVDVSSSSSNAVSSNSAPPTSSSSSSNNVAAVSKKKQAWWLEHSDELAVRYGFDRTNQTASADKDVTTTSCDDEDDDDKYWLLGIPHPFKGPAELKTTLYLWKPGAAATAVDGTTTVTLHGPAGGCSGDVYVSPGFGRMVSVGAETGQLYEWGPSLKSDFAGVMYPVGYKVVTDNLEYIEDEDELDEVVAVAAMEEVEDNDDEKDLMKTEIADEAIDPDLAEAMRLSLLEHNRQQKSTGAQKPETRISVLGESDDIDEFMVPCWPENVHGDADDLSSPGSPQRGRAFSNAGMVDEENAFEHYFLEFFPQTVSMRKELKTLALKRVQQQELADNSAASSDKPKIKGKRTRTANVEVLLQCSIDPELRTRIGILRGKRASGKGSSLTISDDMAQSGLISRTGDSSSSSTTRASPVDQMSERLLAVPPDIEREVNSAAIAQASSPEEKSVAMELLHLSPLNADHKSLNTEDVNRAPLLLSAGKDTIVNGGSSGPGLATYFGAGATLDSNGGGVTLLEPIPAHAQDTATDEDVNDVHDLQTRTAAAVHVNDEKVCSEAAECAACFGRMVLHSCGLREKPIDYEALVSAERERKEREAAEKHRARAEKRRIAEAKRREVRRQKKLDDELMNETVRSSQIEVQQFEQPNVREQVYSGHGDWEQQETYAQVPRGSSMLEYNHVGAHASVNQCESDSSEDDGSESREKSSDAEDSRTISHTPTAAWNAARQDSTPVHRETIRIDGTEVKPSTSLHPIDALAALAGLADSMSKPLSMDDASRYKSEPSRGVAAYGGWHANDAEAYDTQPRPPSYEYQGSRERSAYISHAFKSTAYDEASLNGRWNTPGSFAAQSNLANMAREQHQQANRDDSKRNGAAVERVHYRDTTTRQKQSENPTIKIPHIHSSAMTQSYSQHSASVSSKIIGQSAGSLSSQSMESPMDQAILLAQMANTVVTHQSHNSSIQQETSGATVRPVSLSSDVSVRHQHEIAGSSRLGNDPSSLELPTQSQEESEAHALLALAFCTSPKPDEISAHTFERVKPEAQSFPVEETIVKSPNLVAVQSGASESLHWTTARLLTAQAVPRHHFASRDTEVADRNSMGVMIVPPPVIREQGEAVRPIVAPESQQLDPVQAQTATAETNASQLLQS